MRKNLPRGVWLICLTLTFSLACLSGIQQQIEDVQKTAESAVEQGQEIISQGQEIIKTAQAFATQNPNLITTIQSFATEHPSLLETAKAYATENEPETLHTLQALSTELSLLSPGQVPSDIPTIAQDKIENLVSSDRFITYIAKMSTKDVADFYEREMPAQGWQARGTKIENETSTILEYMKENRQVYIVLNNSGGETQVVITIETQ